MIYFHPYSKIINERVTTDWHEYSWWIILVKSQQIKCSSVISSSASSPPPHFPTVLSSQLFCCCHSWLLKCFLVTDLSKRWLTFAAVLRHSFFSPHYMGMETLTVNTLGRFGTSGHYKYDVNIWSPNFSQVQLQYISQDLVWEFNYQTAVTL